MKIFVSLLLILINTISYGQKTNTIGKVEKDSLIHEIDSLKSIINPSNDCCCTNDNTVLCADIHNFSIPTPYVVTYDFKTGNIAYPLENGKPGYRNLKRSDVVKIKIVNFNRFLYQAIINGKDSTHYGLIDNSNLFGSFSSISNLTTLVSNLAAVNAAGQKSVPIQQYFESFTLPSIDNKKNDDKKAIGRISRIKETRIIELEKIFEKNTKYIRLNDISTHKIKDKIDSLISYSWSRITSVLREQYPTCDDFKNITDGTIRKTIENSFFDLKSEVLNQIDAIKLSRYEYLDETALYSDLIFAKGADTLRVQDSLIKTYYIQVQTYLTNADSILSYKNLQTTIEPFDKMKGAKPCFTSEPIFLLGDSKIINVQIRPWSDSIHNVYPQNFTIELPWSQKHIWGVAGGFYTGTLHNKLYTSKYDSFINKTTNPQDTIRGYKLVSDNTGGLEFGINVLAYSDWKLNSNDKDYTYLGIAFGAGSTIESKPKPRVFIGANLSMGMNNRIVVTGGITGGFVDRLSSAYDQKSFYSTPQTGYLKDVLSVGGFLSFSYSFINK